MCGGALLCRRMLTPCPSEARVDWIVACALLDRSKVAVKQDDLARDLNQIGFLLGLPAW